MKYAILTVVSVSTIYPIFWLLTVALKSQQEYTADPFGLPPHPTLANFGDVIGDGTLQGFFVNSVTVTVASVAIVTIIATLAGYALARFRVMGGNVVLMAFLISQMVPTTLIAIPLYLELQHLGLLTGYTPLIISYVVLTLGLSIFLARGFFRSVPQDILDAAYLDGCGELRAFYSVMVPMALSGLLIIVLLNSIAIWNEYFIALIVVQDQGFFTLPLGLAGFQGEFNTDWVKLAAGLLLSMLPTIVIYLKFQDQIVHAVGRSAGRGGT